MEESGNEWLVQPLTTFPALLLAPLSFCFQIKFTSKEWNIFQTGFFGYELRFFMRVFLFLSLEQLPSQGMTGCVRQLARDGGEK